MSWPELSSGFIFVHLIALEFLITKVAYAVVSFKVNDLLSNLISQINLFNDDTCGIVASAIDLSHWPASDMLLSMYIELISFKNALPVPNCWNLDPIKKRLSIRSGVDSQGVGYCNLVWAFDWLLSSCWDYENLINICIVMEFCRKDANTEASLVAKLQKHTGRVRVSFRF